ncbi:MAG TPA: hypothetical protein VMS30_04280 [Phycisphaerales bacterium]|nr:hypothetical protein [Phycisphaerales bacterium]
MTAMAGTTRPSKSSELAAKAEQTLSAGDTFEAERMAMRAMASARSERDYECMATIVGTLLEARQRRLKAALSLKRITIIDAPIGEDVKASKGMYLVRPPQVGADARRLRLAAFEQNVPAVVLCREPLTRIKLVPVVSISPGTTVRAKVLPPKSLDKPDVPWFIAAMQALGAMAIDSLDPSMSAERRVDALLERLDAVPEHEGLHVALQQACLDARVERDQDLAERAARKCEKPDSGDPAATRPRDDDENGDEDQVE